ncbi:MAG: hypothetical protein JOZ92_03830 [Candidatus Dormibacteraeota bacterium]|nr:hypothetical protein [Candidatus Dormibacteraeota bacterium]
MTARYSAVTRRRSGSLAFEERALDVTGLRGDVHSGARAAVAADMMPAERFIVSAVVQHGEHRGTADAAGFWLRH